MANTIEMPTCPKCGDKSNRWIRIHIKGDKKYVWECNNWVVTYSGSCAHAEMPCGYWMEKEERKERLSNVC